jgi:hypothetical protein
MKPMETSPARCGQDLRSDLEWAQNWGSSRPRERALACQDSATAVIHATSCCASRCCFLMPGRGVENGAASMILSSLQPQSARPCVERMRELLAGPVFVRITMVDGALKR